MHNHSGFQNKRVHKKNAKISVPIFVAFVKVTKITAMLCFEIMKSKILNLEL